jgi:hypothetical protein
MQTWRELGHRKNDSHYLNLYWHGVEAVGSALEGTLCTTSTTNSDSSPDEKTVIWIGVQKSIRKAFSQRHRDSLDPNMSNGASSVLITKFA